MFNLFLLAAQKLLAKFAMTLIGERFLEWAFFELAERIVLFTETKHDDKWLAKFKEEYEAGKKG